MILELTAITPACENTLTESCLVKMTDVLIDVDVTHKFIAHRFNDHVGVLITFFPAHPEDVWTAGERCEYGHCIEEWRNAIARQLDLSQLLTVSFSLSGDSSEAAGH